MDALERDESGISFAMITTFTGLAVSALLLRLAYLLALPRPLPGIPHNKAAAQSMFGDLGELNKVRYRREWIWSQPKRLGAPLAQLFMLPFRRPIVVVSDYHAVVDICSRRTKDFDRGTWVKERIGLMAPNFHLTMQSRDPRFLQHRALIRDLMTPKFLREVSAPRIYDKVLNLVDLWDLKARITQGRPFPAKHDLHLATLDIICSVAFSMEEGRSALRSEIRHVQSLQSLHPGVVPVPLPSRSTPLDPVDIAPGAMDPELEALLDAPSMVAIAQASAFPRLAQTLALLKPKHARAQWNRHKLIRRQTDRSLRKMASANANGPGGCESALDQLLWREVTAAEKADRAPDVYSPDIRDEVMGYLLAGHDTTATVSSWWIKYIARDPLIQTRLRNALHLAHPVALLEQRPPSHGEICTTPIPYLDAVVEETLRVASVATLVVRTAVRDTHIMGYAIPRGTSILLPLTGPSLTQPALPDLPPQNAEDTGNTENAEKAGGVPSWGDDVREFKPERWLKKGLGEKQPEEYFDGSAGPNLAFSAGPRGCFGRRLALMQLRILMTLLLWHFEMEHVGEALDGDDVVEMLVNVPKLCYAKLKRIEY